MANNGLLLGIATRNNTTTTTMTTTTMTTTTVRGRHMKWVLAVMVWLWLSTHHSPPLRTPTPLRPPQPPPTTRTRRRKATTQRRTNNHHHHGRCAQLLIAYLQPTSSNLTIPRDPSVGPLVAFSGHSDLLQGVSLKEQNPHPTRKNNGWGETRIGFRWLEN